MDDDLDPEIKASDIEADDLEDTDDPLMSGKNKSKSKNGDGLLSLDEMADEEDGPLDDDKYDDEDLW